MKKQKALPASAPEASFANIRPSAAFLSSLPEQTNVGPFFFSTCPSKGQIAVSSCHLASSQGQRGRGCWYWTATACYCNAIHRRRDLGSRSMNPAALPSWLCVSQALLFCAGQRHFKIKDRTPNFHPFLCPLSRNQSENCSSLQGWNHSFSTTISCTCTQPRLNMRLVVSSYRSAYEKFCSWDGHVGEGTQQTFSRGMKLHLFAVKEAQCSGTLIPEVLIHVLPCTGCLTSGDSLTHSEKLKPTCLTGMGWGSCSYILVEHINMWIMLFLQNFAYIIRNLNQATNDR